MINHARTLLLNVGGPDAEAVGEELIPSDYTPKILTTDLAKMRAAIFGDSPDRSMLNYWAKKLLAYIRMSDLAKHVTGMDSRITYLPFDNMFFDECLASPSSETVSGTDPLYVINRDPLTRGQRLLSKWVVHVLDGTTVRLTNETDSGVSEETYTLTNGLSGQHSLPGSPYLKVAFRATAGNIWTVKNVQRPRDGLHDLWMRLSVKHNALAERMFGEEEPYATLKYVWRNVRADIGLRLSAAVLAYIYRVNELD